MFIQRPCFAVRALKPQPRTFPLLDGGDGVPQAGSDERLQSADQEDVPRRRRKRNKPTKLQRQSTLVRRKVESLPSFWPIFIVLVSAIQVVAMIVLLIIRGLAPIRVSPASFTEEFPSLVSNTTRESVTYYRSFNLWIGPSAPDLILLGAKFTPCMRTDFGIRRRNSAQASARRPLGCCRNAQWVGTTGTGIEECIEFTDFQSNRTDFGNVTCLDEASTLPPPNFHPCCISITGQCRVMHVQECMARNGKPQPDADNCEQVNCLREICGFNEAYIGEADGNFLLPTANQFWRWFLSLFIHLGVIHMIIAMPVQLYVGIKIERTIGWLRVGLIYLISGVGGNIVSVNLS